MNSDVQSEDKEVEVVLENEENDAEVIPVSDKSVDDPDDAIQELRRKIEEAEMRAKHAEERARSESIRASTAMNEVEDTHLHLINNAIDSVKNENANLKARMKMALNEANHDAVADIQEALSMNAAKLLQLENGLEAMKSQPKKASPAVNDVLEDFKSRVSRRSAEWADANPEYIRNPRLFQKVIAAHNLVTADGVQADTDEYFTKVEAVLGIQNESRASSNGQSAPSQASSSRRSAATIAAPPSAPPSRGSNGMGSNPNVIRLSSDERELARTMGMTDKEYAASKLALQKEGRIGQRN
jgi:hypothetical protein